MSRLNNKKGFTLIELVIVLAIAALILAAILVAVGGAQRSRRDSQRKNDLGTIASDLEQSASNNSGAYPMGTGGQSRASFDTDYLTSLKDPTTGNAYALPAALTGTSIPTACPSGLGAGVIDYYVSGRKYLLCMGLETGDSFPSGN